MLKNAFFLLTLCFLPLFIAKTEASTYVVRSTPDQIFLSNGAVFAKSETSPFFSGDQVATFADESGNIFLTNPNSKTDVLRCSLLYLDTEGLPEFRVSKIDFATQRPSQVLICDGRCETSWKIEDPTNSVANWRIDDRVFFIETLSEGHYQIFNVDLQQRLQPGSGNYFVTGV